MTRLSNNMTDTEGFVQYGYDYTHQVWVKNYIIQPCAHPLHMRQNGPCCAGNMYAGLDVRDLYRSKGDSL